MSWKARGLNTGSYKPENLDTERLYEEYSITLPSHSGMINCGYGMDIAFVPLRKVFMGQTMLRTLIICTNGKAFRGINVIYLR